MMTTNGLTRWQFGTGSMSSLANQLSRALGTHVIDRTGITDKFVFNFEFMREPDVLNIESSQVATALKEQIGLTITNVKAPRGFIVIDSIERPAPDAPYDRGSGGASSAPQKFDVASIKPCDSSALPPGARGGGGAPNNSPGHVLLNCQSVKGYIQAAYLIYGNGSRARPEVVLSTPIEGGPDWIASERYTIEATAAPGTPVAIMQGPMLQSLLADRFALRMHWDTREIPVYALTVAKEAPKMARFVEGSCVPPAGPLSPLPSASLVAPDAKRCARIGHMVGPNMVVDAEGLTIDEFASFFLFLASGRQVVDKTGLTTKYNFHLEYAPTDEFRKQMAELRGDLGDPTAPEIFTAVRDQLGLKLESSKGPGRFLVIDHVERPKPN
jgi:uncharacterized protein (TIGR03435 family)